jgi:hypothetical protein
MNSMAMIPPVRTSMLPFATAQSVSVYGQGFGFSKEIWRPVTGVSGRMHNSLM